MPVRTNFVPSEFTSGASFVALDAGRVPSRAVDGEDTGTTAAAPPSSTRRNPWALARVLYLTRWALRCCVVPLKVQFPPNHAKSIFRFPKKIPDRRSTL
jgi:hypothetical protein